MFLKLCKPFAVAILSAFAMMMLVPVTLVRTARFVFHHRRLFAAAHNVLVYFEGGFAHTIIAGDTLRRLYPDEDNLVVFFALPDRHNRAVSGIWGDQLDFLWLDTAVRVPVFGYFSSLAWRQTLERILVFVLSQVWPERRYLTHGVLVKTLPVSGCVGNNKFRRDRLEARYYSLVTSHPASALRLPETERQAVYDAISARHGDTFPRSCNLYLRDKGGEGNGSDLSSSARRSAPMEDYLPTIELLNKRGYRVLLTGDVAPSEEQRKLFGDGVVDGRKLNIDIDLYHLFAGTECDAHIGNLSGGSVFTSCTDIPSLLVDAFSFGEAMPYATVHYKYLLDEAGYLMSPQRLFSDFTFDYRCDGFRVQDNTAEQIAEAVEEFIDNLAERPFGINPSDIGLAEEGWFCVSDARISPVWLSRFEEQKMQQSNKIAAQTSPQ